MELSVLCASNLVAKDLNGYSDPYCEFKIDDEVVFKTGVKKKTLSPEWNELVTIRLPSENEFLRVVSYYILDYVHVVAGIYFQFSMTKSTDLDDSFILSIIGEVFQYDFF